MQLCMLLSHECGAYMGLNHQQLMTSRHVGAHTPHLKFGCEAKYARAYMDSHTVDDD